MKTKILAAALALAAGAHASTLVPDPKLVVLVVVDQFRYDTLFKVLPHVGDRGFKRLLAEGRLYSQARYRYASTYTAPGHACLSTGAYPDRTGIVANERWDRDTNKPVSVVFDRKYPVIGAAADDPEGGASAVALRAEAVADRLAPGGRAVAISLKERSGVMLAGHRGKAFWYDEAQGELTTSTYYMNGRPLWLESFVERAHPDRQNGAEWKLALPERAYALLGPDDEPFEGDAKGLGRRFPHVVKGREAFTHTPFATQYELDAALAAIEGERLGDDAIPDLLAISLTPPDLVGHTYGPDSWELLDIMVRLDAQLATFIDELDRRFGPAWSMVLTADHGSCPVPERMARLGYPAARIKKKTFTTAAETALAAAFGPGPWVLAAQDPCLYLDLKRLASHRIGVDRAARIAADAVAKIPGVAAAYTATELAHPTPALEPWARSYDAERSGEVMIAMQPFYFWGKYGEKDCGESHGTHHEYDQHVPLILRGARIAPGAYTDPVEMTGVAATLAALLNQPKPADCQGDVLPGALAR